MTDKLQRFILRLLKLEVVWYDSPREIGVTVVVKVLGHRVAENTARVNLEQKGFRWIK